VGRFEGKEITVQEAEQLLKLCEKVLLVKQDLKSK
jgi:hypothetical protein